MSHVIRNFRGASRAGRAGQSIVVLFTLGIAGVGRADIADLSAPTLDRSLTRENFFDWVDFDPYDAAVSWPGSSPELADNHWTPYLGERFTYDENIFRLPSAGAVPNTAAIPVRHDEINTVSAGLDGNVTASGQRLEVLGRVDDNRFVEHGNLDNVSANVQALFSWTLGPSLTGELGGAYERSLTDFTDYYLVTHSFLFTKDIVTTRTVFGSAEWALGSHWQLVAEGRHTDTSQTSDPGDPFKGDTGTLRAAYITTAGTSLAVDYQYATGNYGLPLEVNGVPIDRDFREQTVRLEISSPLSETLHLLANAGYLKHDYTQDPAYDFAGGVWDASLVWHPGAKTELALAGSRSVYADIDAQTQYFVSQSARVIAQWSPTAALKVEFDFSRDDQHFIGPNEIAPTVNVPTHNLNYSERLSLAWSVSRPLQIVLSGRYADRHSNAPVLTYDDTLVSASVRARF